jgi:hypothetical protein
MRLPDSSGPCSLHCQPQRCCEGDFCVGSRDEIVSCWMDDRTPGWDIYVEPWTDGESSDRPAIVKEHIFDFRAISMNDACSMTIAVLVLPMLNRVVYDTSWSWGSKQNIYIGRKYTFCYFPVASFSFEWNCEGNPKYYDRW